MINDSNFTIESNRLILRSPSLEDIPFIFAATRFPGFNDGMQWNPPNTEEDLVEPYHRNIKARQDEIGYSFTIETKENSTFLGRISIRKTEIENRWNVGFWTHPDQQGKGIMSEALYLILTFGFKDLNAESIEAYHAVWNKASEKVLKRNGFKFVRNIKEGFIKYGKWVEENLLIIDKNTWNSMKFI